MTTWLRSWAREGRRRITISKWRKDLLTNSFFSLTQIEEENIKIFNKLQSIVQGQANKVRESDLKEWCRSDLEDRHPCNNFKMHLRVAGGLCLLLHLRNGFSSIMVKWLKVCTKGMGHLIPRNRSCAIHMAMAGYSSRILPNHLKGTQALFQVH